MSSQDQHFFTIFIYYIFDLKEHLRLKYAYNFKASIGTQHTNILHATRSITIHDIKCYCVECYILFIIIVNVFTLSVTQSLWNFVAFPNMC